LESTVSAGHWCSRSTRVDACAHQAKRSAVDFPGQHLAGDREDLCRSWVGAWIDCERVRCLKSAVFSFSVMVSPESSLFLRRADTFSHSRHSVLVAGFDFASDLF